MLEQILPQIYTINPPYQAIVAHGEFPQHQYLVQLICNAQSVICCDGAIHNLLKHNINPQYIIGDCDSLDFTIKRSFAHNIIEIPDQNSNDLTKAVNFTLQQAQPLQQIIIFGATGLREDHTLANIYLLAEYSKQIANIAIVSDYGIFTSHHHPTTLATLPGQQISLFTLELETTITCQQLKWPLVDFKCKSWYSGTLNQATANNIHLQSSGAILAFRAFTIK